MSQCPKCHQEAAPGQRWCGVCHASLIGHRAQLASPGRRLGAYFLDVLTPMLAVLAMMSIAGAGLATGSEGGGGMGLLFALALFVAYVVWAIRLFAQGTTPGKKMLGMRVVKEDGQPAGFGTMLAREWIGKWISAVVLSMGFIWILLDKDRQGWHDKLVSTYVVE